MKILIKNGRVVDPANDIDEVRDILIEGNTIAKVAKGIIGTFDLNIDAKDKIVMPGLVDMHVHLREPGREDKETVASGTYAAAKGGVTSVVAMPNTSPAMDSAQSIELLKEIIRKTAKVNVFICGAITKGRLGLELADVASLHRSGAVVISDDGFSVDDDRLMEEAFRQAAKIGLPVICHCEDKTLSAQGVVNLGVMSTKLGLRGISRESEYKRVQRDIDLASRCSAHVHIAHVSCKESVELIAQAKKNGVRLSAETAPHYFALSEEALINYDTNLKMNPPLRTPGDVKVIKEALKSGIIDAIASDHAPHTENEKDIEFERSEFGVVGLETELSVAVTELVHTGFLDWKGLIERLALRPAQILGIAKGTLGVGRDADLVVMSPDSERVISRESLASKSKNSPFLGRKMKGEVVYTICAGVVVHGIHS